jgi:hypothetical protein
MKISLQEFLAIKLVILGKHANESISEAHFRKPITTGASVGDHLGRYANGLGQ